MVTHAVTDYTFYSITIISVTRTCILYNNLSTSEKKSLFINQFDRLCFSSHFHFYVKETYL